jgi:oxygen-independent coproporphyrinogen-3 oxidase
MSEAAESRLGEETTAGSYFISNYPPYSFWNPEEVTQARAALDRPPRH